MAKVGVTLTGDWKKFRQIMSVNQMKGRIESHIRVATRVNAAVVKDAIERNIKRGEFTRNRVKNARLTRLIKHGTRPLVDSGDLSRSIVAQVFEATYAEVGILKSDPKAWIAEVNHEGIIIPVTPAMRAMFKALAYASDGNSTLGPGGLMGRAAELFSRMPGGWKPLKESTAAIKIPSRPFIRDVAENKAVLNTVGHNWLMAAIHGIADVRMPMSKLRRKV